MGSDPLSDTGPLFVHRSTGDEDYWSVGMGVTWPDWSCLRAALQSVKDSASKRGRNHEKSIDQFKFGGCEARMAPDGLSMGKPGKGLRMDYVLECDEMVIMIANRSAPRDTTPNVWITARGRACLVHGGLGCLGLVRDMIIRAGGEIEFEIVSRVDMALDVMSLSTTPFYDAVRERRFITRIKRLKEIEHYTRTLRFGSHPMSMTIYDKLGEVRAKRDPALLDLMVARRWHGETPRRAIRIEYRLGRQKLKEFGVSSPADYYRLRADVAGYLTHKWLRFTSGPVDWRNPSRAEILPEWQVVADGFAAWTGQPSGKVLAPLPPAPVDISQTIRAMHGLLEKVARDTGRTAITFNEHYDWIMNYGLHG